jgi:hypothetical protein
MNTNNHGGITILILILGLTITIAIASLVTISAIQYNGSVRKEMFERALTIAQSGVEYYRWHLAHNPLDFKDGTNHNGPYIHTLSDPYGKTEATFSLTISPPSSGSSITTIESTGWLNSHPEIKRKIISRYGIPSLAKYSFLHNSNVWFGSGLTVHGSSMSNGGIRMDGINESTIKSAKQTYTCGTETGCDPSQTKNGIWGSGGPSQLWEFPVTTIDFNSLQVDFALMKTAAQNSGLYLNRSNNYGYHLLFNSNGQFTVYRVTGAQNQKGWDAENGCVNLYQKISSETNIGTYTIANKPLIFIEDNVWVNGIVNGKVTIVAARFPLLSNYMNIWINNNLTYLAKDGHSQIGLIAQNNIYFGLDVPNNFEIDGALLASSGRIIRHNYKYSGCSNYNNGIRSTLVIYGSIISNQKSYWNYGTAPTSGFITRDITYDNNLYFNPPPFFPSEGDYELISWEE